MRKLKVIISFYSKMSAKKLWILRASFRASRCIIYFKHILYSIHVSIKCTVLSHLYVCYVFSMHFKRRITIESIICLFTMSNRTCPDWPTDQHTVYCKCHFFKTLSDCTVYTVHTMSRHKKNVFKKKAWRC